jgi:hypothetical protein
MEKRKAILSHGPWGNPHSQEEIELVFEPLWWQKQGLMYTASGYGKKIPSHWVTYWKGQRRRVYITIWSNSGVAWIVNGDQKPTIDWQ